MRHAILVVEDDPLQLCETVALLSEAGFRVLARRDADEALGVLLEREEEIAAVLTDVVMPGHSNGVHLAEMIARHWPEIRVIVTSGMHVDEVALPSGTAFLPKPWRLHDVLGAMQGTLAAA